MEDIALLYNSFTRTPEFNELSFDQKQEQLRLLSEGIKQRDPDAGAEADSIANVYNQRERRLSGLGRYTPNMEQLQAAADQLDIKLPAIGSAEFESLSEDDKVKKVEEFRAKSKQLAQAADPLNAADVEYFLGGYTDQMKRYAQGADTNWVSDKGQRTLAGFVSSLARYTGQEEASDKIFNWFETNPNYDDDFTAKFAQGLGDVGATTLIFLGASAATSGLGGGAVLAAGVGTGAVFGGNVVSRYNEGYKKAIAEGFDDQKATEAGLASMPAAAVDTLADRLLAGKLLGVGERTLLKGATTAERIALLPKLIASEEGGAILKGVARDMVTQGASEVAGDFSAGYGAYLATGDKNMLTPMSELKDSFLVGAALGGAITGAVDGRGIRIRKGEEGGIQLTSTSAEKLKDIHSYMGISEDTLNAGTADAFTKDILGKINDGSYTAALDAAKEYKTLFDAEQEIENKIASDAANSEVEALAGDRFDTIQRAIYNSQRQADINSAFRNNDLAKQTELKQDLITRGDALLGQFEATLAAIPDLTANEVASKLEQRRALFESSEVAADTFNEDQAVRDNANLMRGYSEPKLATLMPARAAFFRSLSEASQDSPALDNETNGVVMALMDKGFLAAQDLNPSLTEDQWYNGSAKAVPNRTSKGQLIRTDNQGNRTRVGAVNKTYDGNMIHIMQASDPDSMIDATYAFLGLNDNLRHLGIPTEIKYIEDNFGPVNDPATGVKLAQAHKAWARDSESKAAGSSLFKKVRDWAGSVYDWMNDKFGRIPNADPNLDTFFSRIAGATAESKNLETVIPAIRAHQRIGQAASQFRPTQMAIITAAHNRRIFAPPISQPKVDAINNSVTAATSAVNAVVPPLLARPAIETTPTVTSNPVTTTRFQNVTQSTASSVAVTANGVTPTEGKSVKDFKKEFKSSVNKLKALKKGHITDRFDAPTRKLLSSVSNVKVNEVLATRDQSFIEQVFTVTDNIFDARSKKTDNPQARVDAVAIQKQIDAITNKLDRIYIQKKRELLGNVINFNDVDGIDTMTRDQFDSFVAMSSASQAALSDQAKVQQREADLEAKDEAWRNVITTAREEVNSRFANAEEFIEAYESAYEGSLSEKHRNLAKTHYEYLHLVNESTLTGSLLQEHAFAANSMIDGSITNIEKTSLKVLVDAANGKLDVDKFAGMFHDPKTSTGVYNDQRGLLSRAVSKVGGVIDRANFELENIPTNIERLTAFEGVKKFLNEDVLGDFSTATNIGFTNENEKQLARYNTIKEQYYARNGWSDKTLSDQAKKRDASILATLSRVMRYAKDSNANEFVRFNIEQEFKAQENVWLKEKDQFKKDQAKFYYTPLLEDLLGPLRKSEAPYDDLMAGFEKIAGEGNAAIGASRLQFLKEIQDMFSEYTPTMRMYSEGFFNTPFIEMENYTPSVASKINVTQNEVSEDWAGRADDFSQNKESINKRGIASKSDQLKAIVGIGADSTYSNNIDFIVTTKLRNLAYDKNTMIERKVLQAQMKAGSPLYEVITDGKPENAHRVEHLSNNVRSIVENSLNKGQSLGEVGQIARWFGKLVSIPALSGMHQIITQPMAAISDYAIRNRDNIPLLMDALIYGAKNIDSVNKFFDEHVSWIATRGVRGEDILNKKRNAFVDESSIKNEKWFKSITNGQEKLANVLMFSLKVGDELSTKSLVLAEYAKRLRASGQIINSIADVELNENFNHRLMSESIMEVERNVNTSHNIYRSNFFTDRSATMSSMRSLLFAFSSHPANLSTQLNLAVRDLFSLRKSGADKAEIAKAEAAAMRRIGAIIGQTLTFSVGRFGVNAMIATGIAAALREYFDDDDDKLRDQYKKVVEAKRSGNKARAAEMENELAMMKNARSALNKFEQRSYSFDSLFKSTIRDSLGAFHVGFTGPEFATKLVMFAPDALSASVAKDSKEKQVSQLEEELKNAKRTSSASRVAQLEMQLQEAKDLEIIPFTYNQMNSPGVGGMVGLTAGTYLKNITNIAKVVGGQTDNSFADWALAASMLGVGQNDLTKFLKEVDRIENANFQDQKRIEEKKEKELKEKRGY